MERILLLDVAGVSADACCNLKQFAVCIEAAELTTRLTQWSYWSQLSRKTTLLAFPGNGANIVKEFLPFSWLNNWTYIGVEAKRIWNPGQDPWAFANRIFPDEMRLGISDIVVIDDVVSSGATCKTLRQVNMAWIPGARWHIATWIRQRAASVRGFDNVFCALECGTSASKVSVNSLSTLLADKKIASSYAMRNFGGDAEIFLGIIAKLQS